jgi:hypothetical protein
MSSGSSVRLGANASIIWWYSARRTCTASSRRTFHITTKYELISRWTKTHRTLDAHGGSATSLRCQFSADFIIKMFGYNFDQAQGPLVQKSPVTSKTNLSMKDAEAHIPENEPGSSIMPGKVPSGALTC